MKKICLAVSVFVVSAVVVSAGPEVKKPASLPDAMLSVTVSDVHGLIDGVGSVAEKVSPMMNGAMLKTMLGAQLGDPQLTGIAPGKGFAVVFLNPTNAFAVVEASEAQMGVYTNAATENGVEFALSDGLLLLAGDKGVLPRASGYTEAVKEKLLSARSADLRIAVRPAGLIAKNRAEIEKALETMFVLMDVSLQQSAGSNAPPEGVEKILEGELRVLLSLAEQAEVAEIVLTPADGSLRITETVVPVVGSDLAALCNAPKVNGWNPKVPSGFFGDGMLTIEMCMENPEALSAFIIAESEKLAKVMEIKDSAFFDMRDGMLKWMSKYEGTVCETVDLNVESGLKAGYLISVKNDAEVLDLFKTIQEDMAPVLKLYESMGISLSFDYKEKVREYKGIPIHQMKANMSFDQFPEEQRQQMEALNLSNMNFEMAIVDGALVYGMGIDLEAAIDKLKDPNFKASAIKARSVYPSGGSYYMDFDIGKYVECIFSLVPELYAIMPKEQLTQLFAGMEPVTAAGFSQDGRVQYSVNIPGDLVARIGQMSMMMQMQQVQQSDVQEDVSEPMQ